GDCGDLGGGIGHWAQRPERVERGHEPLIMPRGSGVNSNRRARGDRRVFFERQRKTTSVALCFLRGKATAEHAATAERSFFPLKKELCELCELCGCSRTSTGPPLRLWSAEDGSQPAQLQTVEHALLRPAVPRVWLRIHAGLRLRGALRRRGG